MSIKQRMAEEKISLPRLKLSELKNGMLVINDIMPDDLPAWDVCRGYMVDPETGIRYKFCNLPSDGWYAVCAPSTKFPAGWKSNHTNDTIDPLDGGGPIELTFCDVPLAPKEFRALLIETYERAYHKGLWCGLKQEEIK